jgi:hypothetical protein
VLSAGPTPHTPPTRGAEIRGGSTSPGQTREQFTAASERITVDIHCVTKWSKLET